MKARTDADCYKARKEAEANEVCSNRFESTAIKVSSKKIEAVKQHPINEISYTVSKFRINFRSN